MTDVVTAIELHLPIKTEAAKVSASKKCKTKSEAAKEESKLIQNFRAARPETSPIPDILGYHGNSVRFQVVMMVETEGFLDVFMAAAVDAQPECGTIDLDSKNTTPIIGIDSESNVFEWSLHGVMRKVRRKSMSQVH